MANQGQQRRVLGRNQPERDKDKARCPRCGGMLHVERLPDDGPRRKFWEWTCLVCGQTYYPGGTGKTATNQTPQETGDRWTT